MLRHRPGAHGSRGGWIRKVLLLGGLAVFLSVTILPLMLILTGLTSPCERTSVKPSWLETANPFSFYNLCTMKRNMASVHHQSYTESESTSRRFLPAVQTNSSSTTTLPATTLPATSSQPQISQTATPSSQTTATTTTTASQPQTTSQTTTSQPGQTDSQPPKETAIKAGVLNQQAAPEAATSQQQQQQQQLQQLQQHSGVDDEIDEIVMPQTEEDYERILKLPHYEECNLCKVCIPYHVVQNQAKAQAHPANKNRHYIQTHDNDVTIEAIRPRNAPRQEHEAVRRRLQQQADSATSGQLLTGVMDAEEAASRQLLADRAAGAGEQLLAGGNAGGPGQQQRQQRHGMWEGGNGTDGEGLGGGGGGGGGGSRRGRGLREEYKEETESDGLYHVQGKVIDIYNIAPGDTKRGPRRLLPNCTVCWGCKHTLEMMAMGTVMAGSYYAHEPGGSPSWLFRVRSNRTKSGWAVVKLWCVPVRKVKQRGLAMCSPPKVYAQVKLLLAQNKIIRQCDLNSIVPALWVEPVMGVIPGHGFRINWLGLWAEIADGTSVQNIQEFGKPKTHPEYMLDLFTNKVNHTEIKLIAIFDVLFSQCDRHQQNIFITEEGKVWAIDNDQVFTVAWRKCGFDSMILPTTQKFMINHLGFFYVLKYPQKNPPKNYTTVLNPLLLLDYRCHVKDAAIGFDYPPRLKQCLQQVSSMSAEEIHEEYGYPSLRMADAMKNRSTDLLHRGFEWTLLYGEPTNQPMHRYKVAPSCCSMTYKEKTKKYECNTPFKQMGEIPFGNPWHGGKWHGTGGADTGTYVGGEGMQVL